MKRFDFNRIKEIKTCMNEYLQTLLNSQKQVIDYLFYLRLSENFLNINNLSNHFAKIFIK